MSVPEPYRVAGNPISAGMALFLGVMLLLICFLFSGVAVNLIIGMAGYARFGDMMASENGRLLYRICQGLSNVLSWGLPATLWAVYVGGFRKNLGLSVPTPRWNLALSIAVILAFLPLAAAIIIPKDLFFLPDALQSVEQWAQEQEKSTTSAIIALLSDQSPGMFILNVFLIAVLPAIMEELFFRGFLLGTLRRIMPLHVAVWLGAVVFSLVHFQLYGFFSRVLLGAILGYLYVWSGDLRAAMIAHFAHNFTNLVLVVLAVNGSMGKAILEDRMFFGVPATIVSTILAVALLYVYFRRVSALTPIVINE